MKRETFLRRRHSLLGLLALVLIAACVPAAGVMPGPPVAADDLPPLTITKVTSEGFRLIDVLELGYDHGPFARGEIIPLIKVSGGRGAQAEPMREDGSGCPRFHRHSSDDLFICGPESPQPNVARFGPFEDKSKRNCGHGMEFLTRAELQVVAHYTPQIAFVPAHYYVRITNTGVILFDDVKVDITLEFPNGTATVAGSPFRGSLAPGESTEHFFEAFAFSEGGTLVVLTVFGSVIVTPSGMVVPIDDFDLPEIGDVVPPTRARFKVSGVIQGCTESTSVEVLADVESQTIDRNPSDFTMKQDYTGSLQAPPQAPQIVTAQLGSGALVAVDGPRITSYISDGKGGFRPDDTLLFTTVERIQLHRSNVNDDGLDDLVSIDRGNGNYSVNFGETDGFRSSDRPQSAVVPQAVGAILATTVGDVNGDRTDDLILIDQSGLATVMRLNKNGSLAGTTMTDLGTGPISAAVVTTGNCDGDAFRDVVVAVTLNNAPAGGQVVTLSGNAGGNLTLRQSLALDGTPSAVTAGDLNGDGKQEVMVADGLAHTVTTLTNDGTGNLATGSIFLAGGLGPVALATADVNGDGDLDLVAANQVSSNVSMFLGDGDNHLFLTRLIPTPAGLAAIAPFDFNKDGKVDVAVGYSGARPGPLPQAIGLNEDSEAGFKVFLNSAQPVVRPVVQKVEPQGKHLIVTCSNCAAGAKVLVDGIQKKTILEDVGRLRAKKAFKQLTAGQSALIQIESDGKLSEWFRFTK